MTNIPPDKFLTPADLADNQYASVVDKLPEAVAAGLASPPAPPKPGDGGFKVGSSKLEVGSSSLRSLAFATLNATLTIHNQNPSLN